MNNCVCVEWSNNLESATELKTFLHRNYNFFKQLYYIMGVLTES
jgi:hypothetical protein